MPPSAPIEGGPASDGNRHVLVLDQDNCVLHEPYSSDPQLDGSWQADAGARFALNSHALPSDTWTSADAADLPILPGLVRYDEVASGEIAHAIRFTVPRPGGLTPGLPVTMLRLSPAINTRPWASVFV